MKKNIKKDWSMMENNCINILKFLSEHPLENITYRQAEKELNIPSKTIHYLTQSGKLGGVGLKYGYVLKIKPKSKWNFAEVVYHGIYETQKERDIGNIAQDNNYMDIEE